MKRQISLLACLLVLVAMVFAMASCVQPEANHEHNYVSSVTKEATCTENGELTYTCACGDTYTDEVQAKGHTPGVLAAVAPTCSTEGKTEGYGCTTCGTATVPQSVIAALGHELGAPATCTTAQVCARGCGKVFVEALGHKGNEATCTEASICYACDIELAEALGHEGNEATCTEASICYACDTELEPALGHGLEYGMECFSTWCFRCGMEWVEATKEHEYFYECDQNCMNCGEYTNWEASHVMNYVAAKAPTCTEMGNIEYWQCELCGNCWDNEYGMFSPLGAMRVKIPMVDHEYRYACDAHCMNCYQLTNEEAAHTLNHVDAVAPTCTENGNVEYWICSDCGTAWDNENATGMPLNRFTVIDPATGHAYFYACDAHCMNCGELTNEDAAHSLKHNAAVAPTCEDMGNIEYWQCEFCGTAWDNANCTGFNLNRFMVIVNATGHEYAFECDPVCIVCREIANPDAEHDVVYVAAKAPTCTANGAVEHWYCSYCDLCWIDEDCTINTSKQSVIIPDLGGHKGHDYDRKCDVCNIYILPEEGEAFKLGMYVDTKKDTYYITGSIANSYYYGTTTNPYSSPDVFLEETNGGFYLYFMSGTSKKYLYVAVNGSKNNPNFSTSSKNVFTLDETTGALMTTTSNGKVYLGTYDNYTTVGASYTSYITGSNASKIDKTQHLLRIEILEPHDCQMSEATCAKAPTCSICGKVEGEKLPHTPGAEATCTAAQTCTVCGTTITAKLAHTGGTATCEDKAVCTVCGQAYGNLADHTYVNGECSVCGEKETVAKQKVTVTTNISTYASQNGWTNEKAISSFKMDDNVTVSLTNSTASAKYYTSGSAIRCYTSSGSQTTIKIAAANDATIVSVKITYTLSNDGKLYNGTVDISSGTVISVNANSISLVVKDGNGASSWGQVRITAIEVVYEH